ncbi:MAG TPA: YkvA family protein [Natronosporangium sp.]|nr:YkvA family protein [Natronosporangium sp.]
MGRKLSRTAAFVALARQVRAAGRGGPPLGERMRAVPRMAAATLRRRDRYDARWRLVLMALAAAYVLAPVDVLPELLAGPLGLVDDAVVVSWLAGALLSETTRFLEWERQRAAAGSVASAGALADTAPSP